MNRIKVDIICPTGGSYGGVEAVIRSWTKNLNKEKFDLRVICLGPTDPFLDDYEKAYYVKAIAGGPNTNYLYEIYSQVVEQLGEPDICIASVLPIMVEVASRVKREKALKMKVVSWIHNKMSFYSEANLGSGNLDDVLTVRYHLALNHNKAEEILEADKTAKVYEIGNPVEVDRLKQLIKDNYNPLSLVHVGRLSYGKGIDVILEALYKSKYPYELKIVGDGELRDEVEGWIKLLKLSDRVKLVGWKSEPAEECVGAAAIVLASESEGFQLASHDASAMGLTVITTPVDGVTDYIISGKNGYYFDYNDADGLAEILDDLAEGKLAFCSSKECIESVERFSIKNYFNSVEKALEEIYCDGIF